MATMELKTATYLHYVQISGKNILKRIDEDKYKKAMLRNKIV